ncbi:hypothetical protein L873DRAFT_1441546 [Choiromyces venosus 120613-1]|uniref:Uncharacterized protein n=1 Tax=Choiromyces venosus 120613-1 TaxID=1336337 RepID=A0A3N4J7V4_9PEZI|nr:hypothetical protein L873DRAFT_1441546 [Choiromyces venosus 120613-1]
MIFGRSRSFGLGGSGRQVAEWESLVVLHWRNSLPGMRNCQFLSILSLFLFPSFSNFYTYLCFRPSFCSTSLKRSSIERLFCWQSLSPLY